MSASRKPATPHTEAAQVATAAILPPDSEQDFIDAKRGLIAPLDLAPIAGPSGRAVWDLAKFAATQGLGAPCPPTVNPSLWRQAQLNAIGGLFQVCPGVHQVRGMDLSNITFIEGVAGRIVVDPLISRECAAAAIELAARHLGERPISALIYTHSHVDHFGGSEAVLPHAAADMQIIAPEHFLHYAVSENVLAGNAMRRRAAYMYGSTLPADAQGMVDCGLGKTTSSGSVGLLPPTRFICQDGEQASIDGVTFIFQLAPETEAPAEMMYFLPAHGALNIADNACAGLHNLYTLRGAEVRNALAWAGALDQSIRRFGADVQVLHGGHHWPRWGRENIIEYLATQRDIYKFIHDQSLRLLNAGLTPLEIADTLQPPQSLAKHWHVREYYGTVAHNAKAIYQKYIGWYDGHPAHLHPLPPAAAGARYVEFMGGADALLGKAQAAFNAGEYRFVAEVLTHLVFADPAHQAARHLQADALEQLGYQAESGPWRNAYLTGAQELRAEPGPARAQSSPPGGTGMMNLVPVESIFDTLAVSLNGTRADGDTITIGWHFTDGPGDYHMLLRHAVLHYWREAAPNPDACISLSRATLIALLVGQQQLPDLLQSGRITIEGNMMAVGRFFMLLDRPDARFNIVTP